MNAGTPPPRPGLAPGGSRSSGVVGRLATLVPVPPPFLPISGGRPALPSSTVAVGSRVPGPCPSTRMIPGSEPHSPVCSVVNAAPCPGDRRTMLVSVEEGVRVVCAPQERGAGNPVGWRPGDSALSVPAARPRGYFWRGGRVVVGSEGAPGPGRGGAALSPGPATAAWRSRARPVADL